MPFRTAALPDADLPCDRRRCCGEVAGRGADRAIPAAESPNEDADFYCEDNGEVERAVVPPGILAFHFE